MIPLLSLASMIGACSNKNPSAPQNHKPVIASLTIFPRVINYNDSAMVTCFASDPDGDPIVFDWVTDGRLDIQGVPTGLHFIYNTGAPTRVFYPAYVDSPIDTAWIQCSVRDRVGGQADAAVYLVIHR